jgi:hypothetical protein
LPHQKKQKTNKMETTKFDLDLPKSITCLIFEEKMLDGTISHQVNNIKLKDNDNSGKLVDNFNLSQGQYISLGSCYEKQLREILKELEKRKVVNIKVLNIEYVNVKDEKGEWKTKQVDLAFMLNGNIYYFEVKMNLNLDTEKNKATFNKVNDVVGALKQMYPDTNVYGNVLSSWYCEDDIKKSNTKNIYFIKDLFNLIGVELHKVHYYLIMKSLGKQLKSNKI